MKALKYGILIFLVAFIFNSCLDEPNQEPFFEDDELSITAYLEKYENDFSMFLELLDFAGFRSAFNAYGNYTIFTFKNDALTQYLQGIGKSRVSDLSTDEAKILVRYHALPSIVSSSYLGYGKLPVRNMEDDELVSNFDEAGLQGIIVNRESKILERDIELNNGIIHVLDKTLTPIVESVVEVIEETGDYSIFLDAVNATGFYPVLDQIYDTLDNGDVQRVFFTVFIEPDSVYMSGGINSFSDLETNYFNGYTDHTNPSDSLNQFVANHFITEKMLFTKDFASGNYQTYNGELLSMEVDLDYKINKTGSEENPVYITFIPDISDLQSKNGVIHSMDKILDIFKPKPAEVIWGFYDQPFARDLGRVNGQDSDHYPNLDLFPNMTGTVSEVWIHKPWSGYGYIPDPDDNNQETSLTFGPPDFDVTVLMPIKIVQGRYKFYFYAKDGSGRATIQVFINGIPIGEPIDLNGAGTWYVYEHYVGEINLTETKQNTIRMVTVAAGAGLLSHVRFEPIE